MLRENYFEEYGKRMQGLSDFYQHNIKEENDCEG